MSKFGRFEFKATKPAETYEGDYMKMDKGYVSIFVGERDGMTPSLQPSELIVTVYLDKGQSVRKMK